VIQNWPLGGEGKEVSRRGCQETGVKRGGSGVKGGGEKLPAKGQGASSGGKAIKAERGGGGGRSTFHNDDGKGV